ncbi:MAG: hypothetical protein ACOZIN_05670 [Myxococcota bacterium]
MPTRFEFFHLIADPPSARVRKWIEQHGLLPQVRFRNLTFDEVKADFAARGGTAAPALWDGERLEQGADAVLARLEAFQSKVSPA